MAVDERTESGPAGEPTAMEGAPEEPLTRTARTDLAAKVAFLRSRGALDHVVETVETHMSWVFLTERRAFKLKKPVRWSYLDFSTVERRRRSCEQELRLGRRLAATVYDAVVPLVATPRGLAIDPDGAPEEPRARSARTDPEGAPEEPRARSARTSTGEIVDWLVAMRRLPADRMLPQMLARGVATLGDADAVGDVLAAFYRDATRTAWTAPAYRRRMRDLVVTVAGELAARGAPRSPLDAIVNAELAAIEREAPALDGRIADGRVVDAHGDLRPEHVCLETPPVVIDALEFDDQLRMLDAASELAFFALECERLGASWFGERVCARYRERAADRVPPPLVAIYRGQHGLTRALIALRRVEDAAPGARSRWRDKARDYLSRIASEPQLAA